MTTLPIDDILTTPPALARPGAAPVGTLRGERLGRSREGRDVTGYLIGNGGLRVSLIAGCHADEPVGPAMLDRLAAYLLALPTSSPLISRFTWYLVPHVNPDGEQRNARWTHPVFGDGANPLTAETGLDLGLYMSSAVREPPGDDIEFGFPHGTQDTSARPENRAVADFLRRGAPFALHASFHGMSFAAGPWYLIEAAWIDRTAVMRRHLRRRTRELGYRLHDIDRRGEKGFHRIDEGFTTRPDSRAMVAHFEALDDLATAALFRPSSMEYVRGLGGDPLTLVSEMPLFLVPAECYVSEHDEDGDVVRPTVVRELAAELDPDRIRLLATRRGIEPMPIVDQMRLQLEFLQAGLGAVLRTAAA